MERTLSIKEQKPFPEAVFKVTIKEGDLQSKHIVTLHEPYYQELTSGVMPVEIFIRKAFIFLLNHEPKESILKKFELPRIQKYFPEFEDEARAGFPSVE